MTQERFKNIFADWEQKHPVVDKDTVAAPVMRKPRVEQDLSIDLHGKTRREALRIMEDFFQTSDRRLSAKIVIIHGVGRHSPDHQKILKPAVKEWLMARERMFREIRPGRADEGGPGVTVVRLKKN